MSPSNPGTCPGCGLQLPQIDASAPAGASAACWALYGRLLVREYGLAVSRRVHQLTVSAYAVQHPAGRRHHPIESVSTHLIELCLLLEHGTSAHQAMKLLAKLPGQPAGERRLEPPVPNGTVTVSDVLAAPAQRDQIKLVVERWARNVWDAWRPHHATVQAWTERGLRRTRSPQ